MSTPNQPRRRRSREPEREARLAAVNQRVLAQVRAIRSGEDWAGWLRLAARLRGHIFPNVLLIAAQRADATLAATYGQWQALGRQVGKGQARHPDHRRTRHSRNQWRRCECARARGR